MYAELLVMLVAGIPLVATILDWALAIGISERHHSHHDTYLISATLLHAVVMSMVFMGITGLLLSWLCVMGVFEADVSVVLGFFAAFLVVMLWFWVIMRRYSVKLYDDVMEVTPFVGRAVTLSYADITDMDWVGIRLGSGYRSLAVYKGDKRACTLWGGLDVEQILLRIDRFDALGRS